MSPIVRFERDTFKLGTRCSKVGQWGSTFRPVERAARTSKKRTLVLGRNENPWGLNSLRFDTVAEKNSNEPTRTNKREKAKIETIGKVSPVRQGSGCKDIKKKKGRQGGWEDRQGIERRRSGRGKGAEIFERSTGSMIDGRVQLQADSQAACKPLMSRENDA